MSARRLPVFFAPEMVADSGGYSPIAGKPKVVVDAWLAPESSVPIEIFRPEPVTEVDLARVHSLGYVRGVLTGRLPNGFGNHRRDVARSLPWTSGAMLSAARHALLMPEAPSACAPVSGFHHAHTARGGGFCTFNGLMVAAAALLDGGSAKRVAILDADMHYGNGTDEILARVPRTLQSAVRHLSFGKNPIYPPHAEEFLAKLSSYVQEVAYRCDVVLYQAGADPHVDDPQGGWLTTAQLAERDRIVFDTLRGMQIPCAWNFAGGYQVERDGSIPKVIAIHTNTALAALAAAPE